MIHLVAYTIRNGIIDHDKANARKLVLGTEKTIVISFDKVVLNTPVK